MQIDLERVRERPFAWDETESISAEQLERPELLVLGPVRWEGRIAAAGSDFLLSGKLSYDQTLACTRCLTPVTQPVEASMTLLVTVGATAPLPGEHELEEEDLNVLEVDEPKLHTEPIVFEHLQLNVPMRVLCREDCAGLCPICGANWNEESCDCEQPGDPRWGPLQELRSRFDGSN